MEINLPKTLLLLIATVIIGGFLRFYDNTKNPVSLNIDEVSIGYNAYSILKTRRDEYGVFLPIVFRSVDDYKPGGLIYLTVPSIAVFGLNEFGVRFPTALISTLSLIIFYFLFKMLTNNRYAIAATFLLAVSPWHIYYSRYASESMVATAFFGLGFLAFLKIPQKKWYWIILSSLFFLLSIYTYHSHRLFIPLFLLLYILIKWRLIISNKKYYLIWFGIVVLFSLPLVHSILFGSGEARAGMTIISNDIEFNRQVRLYGYSNLKNIGNALTGFFDNDWLLLFFYWARKYLNYFDPAFLFYSGLSMTRYGSYGLGVLHFFEIPSLVYGVFWLLKSKKLSKEILIAWILIGLLPSSLTVNEQHPLRTLIITPALELISGIGLVEIFYRIRSVSQPNFRICLYSLGVFFIGFSFVWAVLVYSILFPREKGEAFMEGTKEAAEYAVEHKDNYKQVIFDPVRGIDGPYIVNIPHMYILFYSQYDPYTYQHTPKREILTKDHSLYSFDKYTVTWIDYNKERAKKGNLLIGSPWSLPEEKIPDDLILKKIYLTNGKLAYLIVRTN